MEKKKEIGSAPIWGGTKPKEQTSSSGLFGANLFSAPKESGQGGLFGGFASGPAAPLEGAKFQFPGTKSEPEEKKSSIFAAKPPATAFAQLPAEKKPAPPLEEEKKPFLFMGATPEVKKQSSPFAQAPPSAGIMQEGRKADESRVEVVEHIPKISLEELRSMGMNTRTIEEIFNKWRSGLVGLANEMRGAESEMQQYEEKLLNVLKGIHYQLQVADTINKITEEQRQALIIIKRDQEKMEEMLKEIVESVDPYLKQSTGKDEIKSGMGGREDILRKIGAINNRMEEIEQNIQKAKALALESTALDELEESEKNLGKYVQVLKIIEGNIADLKYQIESNYSK